MDLLCCTLIYINQIMQTDDLEWNMMILTTQKHTTFKILCTNCDLPLNLSTFDPCYCPKLLASDWTRNPRQRRRDTTRSWSSEQEPYVAPPYRSCFLKSQLLIWYSVEILKTSGQILRRRKKFQLHWTIKGRFEMHQEDDCPQLHPDEAEEICRSCFWLWHQTSFSTSAQYVDELNLQLFVV